MSQLIKISDDRWVAARFVSSIAVQPGIRDGLYDVRVTMTNDTVVNACPQCAKFDAIETARRLAATVAVATKPHTFTIRQSDPNN
jgi:hypothetical protein